MFPHFQDLVTYTKKEKENMEIKYKKNNYF